MKRKSILLSCFVLLMLQVMSQNYHAANGSSFAGSLGVADNPSSIVQTPFPWDINVLSFQFASATNAVTVVNYSYLGNPALSQYTFNKGNYSRYLNTNVNVHLFNARFALNRQQAIAFGMNIRGYTSLNTGPYNYTDTIKRLKSFLQLNERNTELSANFKSSSWIELFGTYSQTVMDDETARLNAGFTVKVSRGVSGAFAGLKGISVRRVPQTGVPAYTLQSGTARYGYSSNYDAWKKGNTNRQNLYNFIQTSQGSLSIDLGMEYLVKSQAVNVFNDGDEYYDYEWKLGVALLDLGQNQYKYGTGSRYFSNTELSVSDTVLQKKFRSVHGLPRFNDTIRTIINNVAPLAGSFVIINPARLVVNVDKAFAHNLYINGALSLNLSSLSGPEKLYVSELSLLTITPRWETRRLGVYLPVQYNSWGQFLVGGAFKAGPLLIGVHNWANVLSLNKAANGGGYLALVIRPSMLTKGHRDKRLNCP